MHAMAAPMMTQTTNRQRILTVEPRFCGYCGLFLFYRTQAPARVACNRCGVVWRRDAAGRWLDLSRTAG